MVTAQTHKVRIRCIQCSDGVELNSSGDWIVEELAEAAGLLEQCSRKIKNMPVKWNVADMGRVDSAEMVLLIRHYDASLMPQVSDLIYFIVTRLCCSWYCLVIFIQASPY